MRIFREIKLILNQSSGEECSTLVVSRVSWVRWPRMIVIIYVWNIQVLRQFTRAHLLIVEQIHFPQRLYVLNEFWIRSNELFFIDNLLHQSIWMESRSKILNSFYFLGSIESNDLRLVQWRDCSVFEQSSMWF